MSVQSPYLTLREVAEFCRLEATKQPLTAASKFLKRHGIPSVGRGRVLVLKSDLIDALEDGAKARRAWKRRRAS